MVADRSHERRLAGGISDAPNRQLPSLTPLRGIAALWVVLYHYTAQYFPNLDITNYTQVIGKGYLAVDIFFMLSGFVMTHVYHRAFSESITNNYKNFLVARFARLYPLHVFILLLFVATALSANLAASAFTGASRSIPAEGPRSFMALFANIFMVQGLEAGKLSWNYPSWSISVEFLAYLAFPFALPAIWRAPNALKATLALLLFGALAALAFISGDDFNQWDGPITLLRCLPEFLLGTLLYCAFQMRNRLQWLSWDSIALGVVGSLVLCLHFGAPDLLIILLFAGLILVAASNAGIFSKIVGIAALVWLGEISYSLYLVHGFVQFVVTKSLHAIDIEDRSQIASADSLVLMLMMLATCVVVATVTYYSIEIVWRRYLRGLFARTERKRSASVAKST